jgi:hypothetical protein
MRYKSILSQRSNQPQPAFILELPTFRLYEAIIRLYVYKNKQTAHSWRGGPSPLQIRTKIQLKMFIQYKRIVQNIKFVHYSGNQNEKNDIGGAYSTYLGKERCIQDFGGET